MTLEIFKFNPSPATPTLLENGELINNVTRKMWVERYRDPGEFSLSGRLSSGLREKLPPGSLISHADTLEVMIVENHEMVEDRVSDPVIAVTGRSFQSYLEERIVGTNQNWGAPPAIMPEYTLASAYSWLQAVWLINDHIYPPSTINTGDDLANVIGVNLVSVFAGAASPVERIVKRGNLHQRLLEHLAIDDLGVRTVRRNTFGVIGSATNTELQIYKGADHTSDVIFSWQHGDVESVNFLWSIKKKKNAALVTGRFTETVVLLGPTGYERRWMYVDASDLDDKLSEAPIGAERTAIINKMITRGTEALTGQKEINITQADIAKNTRYQYRRDYSVGDLVSVSANRNEMATRRVTEYVEIEDENGESGHPTLALI